MALEWLGMFVLLAMITYIFWEMSKLWKELGGIWEAIVAVQKELSEQKQEMKHVVIRNINDC